MALDKTKCSVIGYGAGQKLWLYTSTDTSATIAAANYFTLNDLPLMAVGDLILATVSSGLSVQVMKIAVTAIAAATGSTANS
jgi:hypothetical protein